MPSSPISSACLPTEAHPVQREPDVSQLHRAENTGERSLPMMFNDATCKMLADDLEAGGSSRNAMIECIRGHVRALSFDSAGCRVVQLAMKVADADVATRLASELQGCVRDAAYSPYANYVLQRIIEVLPHWSTVFVAQELLGVAAKVSQHRFGCRILCRVFEHCGNSPAALKLADELMK